MMPEDEMLEEEMPLEGEEMLPQPKGAFQSMVDGNMPSPAELADLVGDSGPSFHDSMAPGPYGLGKDMGEGLGVNMGGNTGEADFTGQAPLDPELIKQDVRALLNQKAQERAAASQEFQARAMESLTKSGGGSSGGY